MVFIGGAILGAAIGAITFTGSVIAFLKLDGRMTGNPILLPNRHAINIGLAILLAIFIFAFIPTEAHLVFWLIVLVSFALGVLLIIPIGGADMPVVISMLNSYSGWAAAAVGFTLANLALIITGALAGAAIAELTAPPLGAYGIPGDIEQATFGYAESGPPHIY